MLNFLFVISLVAAGAASDGSRSLSDTGVSLGADTTGNAAPVKNSKMLFTVSPVVSGSFTSFLIQNIVALEKVMEGVNENNEAEIRKRDPQLRKIVSSILDLEALGRAALITHWDALGKTPAGKKQRDRYMKLFHELVEENYMEKIRVYIGGNYKITFMGESQTKKGTVAEAKIKKKDADLMVDFLAVKRDGAWHMIDTKLDDTSLEETYRGSFNRIIKKHGGLKNGFPELLKVMEKRLAELKKGKATKL
ncbi:MAG: hypothetical protein JWQ35_1575 [Bacteriovoracaceae bacterium]|nr:hypothetical protein [Bacteriovoracaceae bacterium]